MDYKYQRTTLSKLERKKLRKIATAHGLTLVGFQDLLMREIIAKAEAEEGAVIDDLTRNEDLRRTIGNLADNILANAQGLPNQDLSPRG